MKKALLAAVIAQLEEEKLFLQEATKAAIDAATSEESRPENVYDTRALEASYLAAAQGKRLQEVERTLNVLKSFPASERPQTQVGSGSMVELESEGKVFWYFLLPFGAGIQSEKNGVRTTVVTLDSPLGKLLLGKKVGETFTFAKPGGGRDYEILSIL